MKYLAALLLVTLGIMLAGCVQTPTATPTPIATPTAIAATPTPGMQANDSGSSSNTSLEYSRELAAKAVAISGTYAFDGRDLTLVKTTEFDCAGCYEFTFNYTTPHPGFGNRDGAPLNETNRTVLVRTMEGAVDAIITDGEWDELAKAFIKMGIQVRSFSENATNATEEYYSYAKSGQIAKIAGILFKPTPCNGLEAEVRADGNATERNITVMLSFAGYEGACAQVITPVAFAMEIAGVNAKDSIKVAVGESMLPLLAGGQFCGGIAAIQCPEGFDCKLDGNHTDAGGVCMRYTELGSA